MDRVGNTVVNPADGPFERFLTSAIVTILTIIFSWKILLEQDNGESNKARSDCHDDDLTGNQGNVIRAIGPPCSTAGGEFDSCKSNGSLQYETESIDADTSLEGELIRKMEVPSDVRLTPSIPPLFLNSKTKQKQNSSDFLHLTALDDSLLSGYDDEDEPDSSMLSSPLTFTSGDRYMTSTPELGPSSRDGAVSRLGTRKESPSMDSTYNSSSYLYLSDQDSTHSAESSLETSPRGEDIDRRNVRGGDEENRDHVARDNADTVIDNIGYNGPDKCNPVTPGGNNQLSGKQTGESDRGKPSHNTTLQAFNVRDFLPRRLQQKFLQTLVAKGGIAEGDLEQTEFGYEVTTGGRLAIDNDKLIEILEEFLIREGCLDSSGSDSDDLFNRTLETITEENSDDFKSSDDDDSTSREDDQDMDTPNHGVNNLKRLHTETPALVTPYKFPKMQCKSAEDEDVSTDSSGEAGSMEVTFSDLEDFAGDNIGQRYMPLSPASTAIIGPYMDRSSQYARDRVTWTSGESLSVEMTNSESPVNPLNIPGDQSENPSQDANPPLSESAIDRTDNSVGDTSISPTLTSLGTSNPLTLTELDGGERDGDKVRAGVSAPVRHQLLSANDNDDGTRPLLATQHPSPQAQSHEQKPHQATTDVNFLISELQPGGHSTRRVSVHDAAPDALISFEEDTIDNTHHFEKHIKDRCETTSGKESCIIVKEDDTGTQHIPKTDVVTSGDIKGLSSPNDIFDSWDNDGCERLGPRSQQTEADDVSQSTTYRTSSNGQQMTSFAPASNLAPVIKTSPERGEEDVAVVSHGHHDNVNAVDAIVPADNEAVHTRATIDQAQPSDLELLDAIESQIINIISSRREHNVSDSSSDCHHNGSSQTSQGVMAVSDCGMAIGVPSPGNQYVATARGNSENTGNSPHLVDSSMNSGDSWRPQTFVDTDTEANTGEGIPQVTASTSVPCDEGGGVEDAIVAQQVVYNADNGVIYDEDREQLSKTAASVSHPLPSSAASVSHPLPSSAAMNREPEPELDQEIKTLSPHRQRNTDRLDSTSSNRSVSPAGNSLTFSEHLTFQIGNPGEEENRFLFRVQDDPIPKQPEFTSPSKSSPSLLNHLESEREPTTQAPNTQPECIAKASRDYSPSGYATDPVNSPKSSLSGTRISTNALSQRKEPDRDVCEFRHRRTEIPIAVEPHVGNVTPGMKPVPDRRVGEVDNDVNGGYNSASVGSARHYTLPDEVPNPTQERVGRRPQPPSKRDQVDEGRVLDSLNATPAMAENDFESCHDVALHTGVSQKPLIVNKKDTELGVADSSAGENRSCRALATSTALARREDGGVRGQYPASDAMVSAVASAEAVGENPYIAVARASARAATVATASAAQTMANSSQHGTTGARNRDITVMISTSCVISDEDKEGVIRQTQAVLQSAGQGVNVSVQTPRQAAIMDASTQSSPDQKRRNLKITIEQPEGHQQTPEVRSIQCQLPENASMPEIEAMIQTTVKKIIDNESDSHKDTAWSRQLDDTIHRVTEQVVGAYAERQAAFAMEKFQRCDDESQEAIEMREIVTLPARPSHKSPHEQFFYVKDDNAPDEGQVIKVVDRSKQHPHQDVVDQPVKDYSPGYDTMRGRPPARDGAYRPRPASLSPERHFQHGYRSQSHQPPPERHSYEPRTTQYRPPSRDHEMPDHFLYPVKATNPSQPYIPPLGSRLDFERRVYHRLPEVTPSSYRNAEPSPERHRNYQLVRTRTSEPLQSATKGVRSSYHDNFQVESNSYRVKSPNRVSDTVQTRDTPCLNHVHPSQEAVLSSTDSAESLREHRKKKKKSKDALADDSKPKKRTEKKLKGILKKPVGADHEAPSADALQDIQQATTQPVIDVMSKVKHPPARPMQAVDNDAVVRSITTPVIKQSKSYTLGNNGREGPVPYTATRESSIQKGRIAQEYTSVLNLPVRDERTPVSDLWKYELPEKETPESRSKINNYRADFLGIGKRSSSQPPESVDNGAIPESAPRKIKPFLVDIDLSDTHQAPRHKSDPEEIKQKIARARPRPPPNSYVDSVWNARELIAARSQERGLNLNADGKLERRQGLPFEPLDYVNPDSSNAAVVRRSKSLSSVDPGSFFVDRKSHTALYETDIDTGEVSETPLVYETNLDEYPNKAKSLTNLTGENYLSVCVDNDDGLEKHRSLGALPTETSSNSSSIQDRSLTDSNKESDAHKSESELRISRSLNKLSLPDWYRSSIRQKKEVVPLPNARAPVSPVSLEAVGDADAVPVNARPVVIQHRVSQPTHVVSSSANYKGAPVPVQSQAGVFELPSTKLKQRQSEPRYQQIPVKSYQGPIDTSSSSLDTGKTTAKDLYMRMRDQSLDSSADRSKPADDYATTPTLPGDTSKASPSQTFNLQPVKVDAPVSSAHPVIGRESYVDQDGTGPNQLDLQRDSVALPGNVPPSQEPRHSKSKKNVKKSKKSKTKTSGDKDDTIEKPKKHRSKSPAPVYKSEVTIPLNTSTDSTTATSTTGGEETGPLCTSTPNATSPMDSYRPLVPEYSNEPEGPGPYNKRVSQGIVGDKSRSMHPSANDSIADSARGSSLIGSSTPSGSPNTISTTAEIPVSGISEYYQSPGVNNIRYDPDSSHVNMGHQRGPPHRSQHIPQYNINMSGEVSRDSNKDSVVNQQNREPVNTSSVHRQYVYVPGTSQSALNKEQVPEEANSRPRQYKVIRSVEQPIQTTSVYGSFQPQQQQQQPRPSSYPNTSNPQVVDDTLNKSSASVHLSYDESPGARRRSHRSERSDNNALNETIRSRTTHSSLEEVLDGLLALPPQSKSLIHANPAPSVDSNESPLERAFRLLEQAQSPRQSSNAIQDIKAGNLIQSPRTNGDVSPVRYAPPAFGDIPGPGDGEKAVSVKCRNRKCKAKAELNEARTSFKSCHNCYTYYCSRDCRKEHWERHKKKCLYSRANSLCKHVIKMIHDDVEISTELTRIARTGYLQRGRGCLLFVFSSPGEADSFVKKGWESLPSPPVFITVPDITQTDLFGEQHLELEDMCRSYNPEIKYVIEVVIIAGDLIPSLPTPRREGPAIKKCMKLRLSNARTPRQTPQPKTDSETLILTAVPGAEFTENMAEKKAREVCFINIQRQLRQRGVSLRHHFPDVYRKLCAYVSENAHFTPITIFPVDSKTGKRFMCLIMPSSDPDIEWMDKPDLMEELGLDTSV